jgi:4-amino-4-deoxy-L-arabinose transferase-like glycosyltransferase
VELSQPNPPHRLPVRIALVLGLCLAAGAALRVEGLGSVPLCPDELHYAADAVLPRETSSLSAIRDLDCLGHRLELRARHGALQPALTHWGHRLLGAQPSPASVRLPSALGGVACIGLIFLAARALWGPRQGLLAAALLATLPLHARFSRLVYLDSLYTAWILAAIWTWVRAWRTGRLPWAFAAGACTGLALSTKVSSPLLLVWLLLVAGLFRRRLVSDRRRAMLVALAGLVGASAVWLPLCDPARFLQAVLRPASGRYADLGGLGVVENLVHQLPWIAQVTATLGLGLLIVLPGAAIAMARAPRPGDGPAVAAALAWLPLLPLHVPPLSGEHGWLPLAALLCLAGGRAVDVATHRLGRVAVALGLAANALLAIPFGLWLWRVDFFSHFNDRRADAREWRVAWRVAGELGPGAVILSTLHSDIVQMRNFRLLFPGALVVIDPDELTSVDPVEMTWCDAILLRPGVFNKWGQTFPEELPPIDAPAWHGMWSISPRGDVIALGSLGRRTSLLPGHFDTVGGSDASPAIGLQARPPFLLFAADLRAQRGDEELSQARHLSELRAGRNIHRRDTDLLVTFHPWPGWEEELTFELRPSPRLGVYDEHLLVNLTGEGISGR